MTANESQILVGHGVSNPNAIFIIDHPQGEDYKNGYALTGNSEYLLKQLLKDQSLYLDQYYRTSLIKTLDDRLITPINTIHGQNINKRYVEANKSLIDQYSKILIDEINDLNPNLLVPLGELAFNFLTGLEGIRKFRGSVLLTSPLLQQTHGLKKQVKVLPTLGPYPYLNTDHKMRVITGLDLSRIPKYASDAVPPETLINVWVCKTASAFRAFLDRNYREDGFLTFDIETFLQIPTCISFCFNGQEACCVPLLDKSIEKDVLALLWFLVAKLLKSPIKKGNQNIKYDWKILNRWGFEVNNVTEDSMLAASTIYCEFPKNLGFLTSIYTELPYFKDEGKEFDPTVHKREQLYLYNAKDSLAAWQIIKKQNNEVIELGVDYVYRKLVELMPIYKRAEERGLRVSQYEADRLKIKYETLYNIELLKIRNLTNNYHFNPLSSQQCNTLVFKELKYETSRYVEGTDEDSLNWLMVNSEHPSYISRDILKLIINCRKLHKVLEILNLPLYPDGRFRSEANLAGAETGRTTWGKTTDQLLMIPEKGKIKIKNLGYSFQNIGKHGFVIDDITYGRDIRNIYIPSYGYIFVEADLSGAEARVDRVLSGNFDMDVFDNPGIHKLTGSWLYDCSPNEIKKNILVETSPGVFVERYHISKTVRHAGERNIKEDTLAVMIQRPRNEAKELLNKFHSAESSIREVFHRDIINSIKNNRNLVMPNGRRRDFYGRIDSSTFNEGISTYPQAIVTDQTKFEGILPAFNKLLWAEFLIEAHDGILCEVPKGRAEEFAITYKQFVEKAIDFRNGSLVRDYQLVIPAEFGIGESWGTIKDLKI